MWWWWVLLLCVAAKKKKKKPPPRKKAASVAVCVSGLARSFVVSRVRRSIWAHAVWPIVDDAEVFFALDEAHGGKYEAWAGEPGWADAADALYRPIYWARMRASGGLGESLWLCRSLVAAREVARRVRYTWVVRLRPDATLRTALPPVSAWPRVDPAARLVWSTYIGGPSCSRAVPRDPKTKGVCLDDNFAIVSRAALDAYFGPWPLSTDCYLNATRCNECRLGCALWRAGVRVGSVPMDIKLLRGVSTRRNATPDVLGDQTAFDRLAERLVTAYDLERPSDADRDRQLADAWRRLKKDARSLRFLVVEPCHDGLAQVLYENFGNPRADDLATPPQVHGLAAPLAHRNNNWLGCKPPPLVPRNN